MSFFVDLSLVFEPDFVADCLAVFDFPKLGDLGLDRFSFCEFEVVKGKLSFEVKC